MGLVINDLLVARDFVRLDPLCNDDYLLIGDGFFDVKVRENIGWWNQYWCQRNGYSPEAVEFQNEYVEPGRYKVYNVTEEWFMARLEGT